MSFPRQIFKAYDIRGLLEGELSDDLAYRVGRAFAQFVQAREVGLAGKFLVVGRDMRPTSLPFSRAVARGIAAEGIKVLDVGLVSTPLFNFACAHYPESAGGIMVTASHNPGHYNGFKMTLGDGEPVGKNNGMDKIRDRAEAIENTDTGVEPEVTEKNPLPDYLDKIFALAPADGIRPLKVAVDAGNGMAAATTPKVLEKTGARVEYLFLEPDGSFPNHEANPLKTETLRDLQAKVVETGADFGLALDGDADRIGLVDEQGEVVEASFVGALLGLEVLRTHPGALMLYDLRSSRIVPEIWEKNGAKTMMCQVGHAMIKKAMKDDGAEYASELSLHLYYHDLYNLEAPDLSLLYLMRLLSASGKKLSEIVAPLKKYFHSGEINFKVADKDKVLRALEEKYAPAAKEVSRLDGLWFGFDWGWFNVRASNTEPVLRLNLEARVREDMDAKLAEIKKIIEP